MNLWKIRNVQMRRYFIFILLGMLMGLVIMCTQFFVPYGFQIIVVMGLAFSSKLGEFIKESIWQ